MIITNINTIDLEILVTNLGAVILRLIAIWITLRYVIPLQWKEAGVRNGLIALRRQLLTIGLVATFLNVLSIIFVLVRLFLDREMYMLLSAVLSVINGAGFLLMAVILYKVYHQQYSSEQKKHHEAIEKLENRKKHL